MSFEYRFEPPHMKDDFNEPEWEDLPDDEIDDSYYMEFQDQVDEYLTDEMHRLWNIQDAYERRNNS